MNITTEANVLLRLVAGDDEAQAAAAFLLLIAPEASALANKGEAVFSSL